MKYLIHTFNWFNFKIKIRKETTADDLEVRMLQFSGGVYIEPITDITV